MGLQLCRKIPEGAVYKYTGFILTEEELAFPSFPLSQAGSYKWCFANVGFTASHAQVLLLLNSGRTFNPRRPGGVVTLSLRDRSGKDVYVTSGPLDDGACCDPTGAGNHWRSIWYDWEPSQHVSEDNSAFIGRELYANVDRFGSYCMTVDVAEPSQDEAAITARVRLQSTWK